MLPQDTSSVVYLKYVVDTSKTLSKPFKRIDKNVGFISKINNPDSGSAFSQGSFAPGQSAIGFDSNFVDTFITRVIPKKEFRFSDIDTVRAESYDRTGDKGPKLFSNHQLTPVHESPQTYNKPNPDWFTILLFVIVFGFMWIKVFYSKILKQLFNAFFNSSASNQIVRDENILIQRASVLLSIMFYLVSALFLYQVSLAFHWEKNWLTDGFSRLIIFAFFIAFVYSVKMILLKIIGFVLDIDKQVASYIFNIFLINNILGLILLPIVIVIAYVSTPFTNFLFFFAFGLASVTFFYRIIRGIVISRTIPKFSTFYLIMYLCAFEIAPLAIIFKLIAG